MPSFASGYSLLQRKNFEEKTKEELVDILVNLTQLKLERTDDWCPQEYFLNCDDALDVLRGRVVGEEHFER